MHNNKLSIIPRTSSGRTRILNITHLRSLCNAIHRCPNATPRELCNYLYNHHRIIVCTRTIQRARLQLGFHRVKEIIQKSLSQNHIRNRLIYAKNNINTNWKLIMFSDEKLFYISRTSNYMYIKTGDNIPHRDVTQNDISVMVWGCVWYNGRSELAIIEGNINADKYIDILKEYFLPVYPNDRFKLLQDNARPHVAKKSMEFIHEFGITLQPNYPPYSPDCNSIELIWNQMICHVNAERPTSKTQLIDAIMHAWDNIPQSHIQSTIEKLPSVMQGIIDKNGGR
jgi:transposase